MGILHRIGLLSNPELLARHDGFARVGLRNRADGSNLERTSVTMHDQERDEPEAG
jgi:hypothetical protein